MTNILNDNEDAGPVQTTSLKERGLEIVQILEQCDDDQSNDPGSSGCENISLDEDEIPTIYLTNDAAIEYVGDRVPIENHTGNMST